MYIGSIWPGGYSWNIAAELQAWLLAFLPTCKRCAQCFLSGWYYNLKRQDDIKCDDMGSWRHNGTLKILVLVSTDDEGRLSIKTIKENPEHDTNVYLITRTYYEKHWSNDVRKIISTLESKLLYKQIPIYSLLIVKSLRYLNKSAVRMFLGQGKISQDWV